MSITRAKALRLTAVELQKDSAECVKRSKLIVQQSRALKKKMQARVNAITADGTTEKRRA